MTSSSSSSLSCSGYGAQVFMCRISASRSYRNVKCVPIEITNLFSKLHMSPRWGFRVKIRAAIHRWGCPNSYYLNVDFGTSTYNRATTRVAPTVIGHNYPSRARGPRPYGCLTQPMGVRASYGIRSPDKIGIQSNMPATINLGNYSIIAEV